MHEARHGSTDCSARGRTFSFALRPDVSDSYYSKEKPVSVNLMSVVLFPSSQVVGINYPSSSISSLAKPKYPASVQVRGHSS